MTDIQLHIFIFCLRIDHIGILGIKVELYILHARLKCANLFMFFFFLDIPLQEPPLQVRSSSLPRICVWSIENAIVRKANEIDILMNTHVAHSLTQLLFWDCKLSPLKYALKSEFSKLDFKVYLSGYKCHIQQAVHYFHRC